MTTIESANAAALADYLSTLQQWLPNGKRHGQEWCVGSLSGEPGDSLKINIAKGVWKDFASGDGGSDPVSLYAALHGLKMIEAAKALGGETSAPVVSVAPAPTDDWIPQVVTDYTEMDPMTLKASAVHRYYNKSGDQVGHILRFDGPDGKRFVPRVHCYDSSEDVLTEEWRSRGLPTPRPLYGLMRLVERPTAQVVIVEGEKCADALQSKLPDAVVVSWAGGANGIRQTDLLPLKGRTLVAWPDNDEPGRKAMAEIAGARILDVPADKPKGWDCADAISEGWTEEQLRAFIGQPAMSVPLTVVASDLKTPIPDPRALYATYGVTTNNRGNPEVNMAAIYHYLAGHATWAGKIWYDKFRNRIRTNYYGPEKDWDDTDTTRALLWFQRVALLGPAEKSHVDSAVSLIAQDTPRNCMADWLTGIIWDEVPRLADLLPLGFGAKRTEYTEAVGRCFAVSLVARVIRPGCKVDTMPVFEGSQGIGKSTALAILGGEFFAESHEQIGTKDFNISLEGRWLMELSELHSMSASEVERVKAVLSTATDRFRSPYDRHFKESPRRVVFAGTTNRDDWHQDPTGGRRFWPVRCGAVDLIWLATHRDQIFAEALAQYRAGRDWYSVPHEDAAREVANRRADDPWEDVLRGSLAETRTYTSSDILGGPLGIEVGKQSTKDARRLSGVMVALGWTRVKLWTELGARNGYRFLPESFQTSSST
jgi:hypothetical protein